MEIIISLIHNLLIFLCFAGKRSPIEWELNVKNTDKFMSLKLKCFFFYIIARLLYATYRFRYFGVENYFAAKKIHPQGAYCLGSWHEHALAGVLGQKGIPYCFLISQSKDGEYVNFISKRFGFQTARGSSSKGGKEARRVLEEKVSQGVNAAFTVDGPRGPRRKCKLGVLITAKNTKTAVLPVAAVSHEPWIFSRSWDKTKIPKIFAKIAYQFGTPINVPDNLSDTEYEELLKKIDLSIDETERQAYENLKSWKSAPKLSILKKSSYPRSSHG